MLVLGPVLVLTELRHAGVVEGLLPLLVCGVAVSFALATAGSAIWRSRRRSGDLLFADLLLWGFIRRWRSDRRLSNAVALLGLDDRSARGDGELSRGRHAELLEQLAVAMDARDPETHGHSRRVARHAALLAKRLGLPAEEVARIRAAAAIHDVGKVETPAEILRKPGGLTDEEFEIVKRHPIDGARMAARLGDRTLTAIVRHHHERFDGGGYPRGLRGTSIPIGARVIAVADTFDAITAARPYRPAKAHREALEVLRKEAGTQLDPKAVEAFRAYYSGLRPVALWAVFTSFFQRLFAGVVDGLGTGFATASKAAIATTAGLVAGVAALHAVGGDAMPSEAVAHPGPASALRSNAGPGGGAEGGPGSAQAGGGSGGSGAIGAGGHGASATAVDDATAGGDSPDLVSLPPGSGRDGSGAHSPPGAAPNGSSPSAETTSGEEDAVSSSPGHSGEHGGGNPESGNESSEHGGGNPEHGGGPPPEAGPPSGHGPPVEAPGPPAGAPGSPAEVPGPPDGAPGLPDGVPDPPSGVPHVDLPPQVHTGS